MPNHMNETYTCTLTDLNNYQSNKLVEKEANEFAAELLMPNAWIKNAIKSVDVSLELLRTLANKCETSLTATALQVSNSCSDRIAVVYSQDERIVWFNKARSFNHYLAQGNHQN